MCRVSKDQFKYQQFLLVNLIILFCFCFNFIQSCDNNNNDSIGQNYESDIDRELKNYVDTILSDNSFTLIPGVQIENILNITDSRSKKSDLSCKRSSSDDNTNNSFVNYVERKLIDYARNHIISVDFQQTARFLSSSNPSSLISNAVGSTAAATAATAATDTVGKSSFLAGFGMGMLAFFLKKMLLPVFIGAQFIKSILIAMFLPTILGSVGKLVGKGLSTFSGLSTASTGINRPHHQDIEDFEFKDVDPYNNNNNNNNEEPLGANFNDDTDSLSLNTIESSSTASPNSRFDFTHNRIYQSHPKINDNSYYLQRPKKKTDFKIFHKIPSSSLLLTSYDPFYSPLLSRLDAVFQQMGLGNNKNPETEKCRERLICMMYANPAKYAPFSNLVSAQLSRELNELRKPASDNPDILRFFRYMKAAKDGQDGQECLNYGGCSKLTSSQASPALLTTFNEINKLVQARKFEV